jgi:hypothetical protein
MGREELMVKEPGPGVTGLFGDQLDGHGMKRGPHL